MNELFLLYTLITSVLILSWVLIILIQYLFNTLKKNRLYQKDIERIRKDIVNHSQHILDSAREKAQEIINAANTKAHEIISQTNILEAKTTQSSNEIAAQLITAQRQELEKARDQLFEEYKGLLEELYKDNVNLFRSISKDIEEKAGSEIKDFKDILERETLESQKIVGEKIESRYQEVQKEIENYRSTELLKVRKNIYKIVENTIELAIGKSLDLQIHEDLVLDALREAIEVNQEARNK